VTGPGKQGGPPRRDLWRGARDEGPASRETSGRSASHGSERASVEPVRPWVEVEDLPTQLLAPRSKARLPLTGAIAVAALVALLAAGFGLLGGRSAGTPTSTLAASLVAAQPSPAPSATDVPPVPRVTPWTDCGTPPDEPPRAVLEVDGHQTPGRIEPLRIDLGKTFDPGASVIGEGEQPDVAEVPMDAITEIWIDGGACAVAWDIELVGNEIPGRVQTLESVVNEDRDPAVTAQNRFQIVVAPWAGDHVLRALFVFERTVVRMAWSIHVPALEAPTVTLMSTTVEIPTVIGCDMTERLANDVEVPVGTCARDLDRNPAKRVEVAPGEVLEFAIEGWAASDTFVYCGQLVDHRFLPRIDPPCIRDQDPLFPGVRFPTPEEAGPWTLAMSTCAVRLRVTGNGFDELCATWYANVLVRE
jgi:hypothetical protein